MGENRKWGWVLAFTVLVAIGLSIVTIIALRRVQQNSASIRQLEASDNKQAIALIAALDKANDQQDAAIVLIRQTNYRICRSPADRQGRDRPRRERRRAAPALV